MDINEITKVIEERMELIMLLELIRKGWTIGVVNNDSIYSFKSFPIGVNENIRIKTIEILEERIKEIEQMVMER